MKRVVITAIISLMASSGLTILAEPKVVRGVRLAKSENETLRNHMEVQFDMSPDPELASLPSIRIDSVVAQFALSYGWDANHTFASPFVDELQEAMAWYIGQKGVRVVEHGEDLRVAVAIVKYRGSKSWGHWHNYGLDIEVTLKFLDGPNLRGSNTIATSVRYDVEEVKKEEKWKYRKSHVPVNYRFDRVMFARVCANLSEQLILALREVVTQEAEPQANDELEPTTRSSSVSFDANVENTEVFVNGDFVGTTPLERMPLAPGHHVIEMRKSGFLPWKRELTLLAGANTRVVGDLHPEGDD